MKLEHTAICDLVVKHRMSDFNIQTPLVSPQDFLLASISQRNPFRAHHEIRSPDLFIVDERNHHRIRHQRAKLLGQIQSQRRPPEPRLMEKADIRVKPHSMSHDCQLLSQQRIAIRQKTVDRIQRRTAIAPLKRKRTAGQAVLFTKHRVERRKIIPCSRSLNAHKFSNRGSPACHFPKIFERCQRPLMRSFVAPFEISAQQSAGVQNLGAHDRFGNIHSPHAGATHLSPSQLHMLRRQPCSHAREPSAETEPANRHIPAHQLTNALRRHLHIAVETKLRYIQQAHFLNDFPVFFDLQPAFRLAHSRPLLSHIHRARLRIPRHQTARRMLGNLR